MKEFTQALRAAVPEETSSALRNSAEVALHDDQETGFRRLAAATIQTAIDDALGFDGQPAYSAIRWLAGDTTEGLTLEICCHLLGLAPDRLRHSLSRHSELLRTRLTRYYKIAVYTRTGVTPAPWSSNAYRGT